MTHTIASSRPRALLLGLLLTATVGCGDSSGGDTGESGATTENPGSSTAETGDTADATGTSADTPTTDDATSTTDDATSTTASTGEPTTGEPAGGPEIVVEFDPLIFQLPEGLDVRDGAAYVGIVSGHVLKIDLATKTVMPFGGFMGLPQDNTAIMTGLVVGPQGEVYLALDVFAPGDFTSGVYKIPAGGGDAVQDPFGPPAPRLAPRDRAVGAAEAGPAPALRAPPWPRGHVRMDMLVRTCLPGHGAMNMLLGACPESHISRALDAAHRAELTRAAHVRAPMSAPRVGGVRLSAPPTVRSFSASLGAGGPKGGWTESGGTEEAGRDTVRPPCLRAEPPSDTRLRPVARASKPDPAGPRDVVRAADPRRRPRRRPATPSATPTRSLRTRHITAPCPSSPSSPASSRRP